MRKLLCAAFAALFAVGSAEAIINGEPDGNRHPYVAAIGFIDAATGRPGAFCTGTLISPTVIVTAGHCTFPSSRAVVWFDSTWNPRKPPAAFGRPVTHPDFNPERVTPNTGDLGVVLLTRPVEMATYGVLPSEGYLDRKKGRGGDDEDDDGDDDDVSRDRRQHEVSIVGYGVQSLPPVQSGERMLGRTKIKSVTSKVVRGYGVKTAGAKGKKGSGMCLGDSGGPLLEGDSNLVLAVHSFGDVDTCLGANFAYRTDTPAARAFLGQFVTLP